MGGSTLAGVGVVLGISTITTTGVGSNKKRKYLRSIQKAIVLIFWLVVDVLCRVVEKERKWRFKGESKREKSGQDKVGSRKVPPVPNTFHVNCQRILIEHHKVSQTVY